LKGVDGLPRDALRRGATILALVVSLVLLWSLTHHYLGLGGDARLYAVQALAREHPNLLNDLYLKDTSQDSYTLFSDFYERCIRLIGLKYAALTLAVAFKIAFYAAAFVLVRRLFDGTRAYLAVAILMVASSAYGAFGVFHYAEDWLTARSAAEALVVAALASSVCGHRIWALLLVCGAILLHPLMALPGLLWLICLWLPFRLSVLGALGGIVLVLGVALIAAFEPSMPHPLVVDPAWLEVVRERSQFLFLKLWRVNDWSLNARPFLTLSLSVLAIADPRAQRICSTAMLVGAAGVAVALIGSLIGPVSILLQGQAWRWVWATTFASVLLLVPTLQALWRGGSAGRWCVFLVICGWTFSTIAGTTCLMFAWILWSIRRRFNDPWAVRVRGAGILLSMLMVAWTGRSAWTAAWMRPDGIDGSTWSRVTSVPGMPLLSFAIIGAVACWVRATRSPVVLSLMTVGLVAACLESVPRALADGESAGSVAKFNEYADWRRAIPLEANVLVVPSPNSAAFAWFTLERPSYLTVDQSSGVVFSRATAVEVRRRSQVLLPLMDPDWRLLSNMAQVRSGARGNPSSVRPLTRERLSSVCGDLQLNFVIAAQNVGFGPLRHALPGGREDWYLYDCRIVNSAAPSE
jgi:hypothetical protein